MINFMLNLHHNFQVKQSPDSKRLFVTLDRFRADSRHLLHWLPFAYKKCETNVFTFTEFASIPAYVWIDNSNRINNKKCGVSFIIVGFLKSVGLPFDMTYTRAMELELLS